MSQSNRIPPRRRPLPRLRVKTGCLTCLGRHKKCDETRPSCQACNRLCLECVWRDSTQAAPQAALQPLPLSSSPSDLTLSPSRVIAGHSGFRSASDQSMFVYFTSIVGPMLCDGRSHPFYRDRSHCLSLAVQVPWLMCAIVALAEHHFASSQGKSAASALRHYGQTIRGLRESVATMAFPEDPVLCAVTFAGLFEERLSEHRGSSMVHFYSSRNFLRTLGISRGSKSRMAFLRIQVDMTIYHITTRALFDPDVQKLSDRSDLGDLEAYLHQIHPGPQDVDQFPSSSFLGPVPGLYMLVHQVTLLARKGPLSMTEMGKAQGYLKRIIDIKALLDATSFLHFSGEDVANPFLAEDCTPRLYVLALEIFLTKIMRPETTSSNPDIQDRVHEAHRLLSKRSFVYGLVNETHNEMTYHLAEPLCWPILVIGVAVLRTEHRAIFEKVLGDLWNVSYNGFVRRISTVLKKVWSVKDRITDSHQAVVSKIARNQTPDWGHISDGLDVLIWRTGLVCLYQENT